MTQMSAAGNRDRCCAYALARQRKGRWAGYTLIESLAVIALVALGTTLAVLAVPDAAQDALERDARRLAAMLDGARAQSRMLGRAVTWQAVPGGFGFRGLAPQIDTRSWLTPEVQAVDPPELLLGPEPMTRPQSVTLALHGYRLTLGSDGLKPFAVVR
jgi:general secretion pathway protein H